MSLLDHSKLIPKILSSDMDLSLFDCGDNDLNDFIKNDAVKYQIQKLAQTMCIFFEDKLVAYYTLACDELTLKKPEKRRLIPFQKRFIKGYPAIKIARMAITKEHQRCGLGSYLIKIIMGLALKLHNNDGVGCKFITVDAYPARVEFYKKSKFVENIVEQERKPLDTVSMRFNLSE